MPIASPFDELVKDLCELQTRRERNEFKQSAKTLLQEVRLAKAAQARDHAHRIQDLDRLAKAHAQSVAVRKQQIILQKFANLDRAAKAGRLSSFEAAKLDVLRCHAAEQGVFDQHRRPGRAA